MAAATTFGPIMVAVTGAASAVASTKATTVARQVAYQCQAAYEEPGTTCSTLLVDEGKISGHFVYDPNGSLHGKKSKGVQAYGAVLVESLGDDTTGSTSFSHKFSTKELTLLSPDLVLNLGPINCIHKGDKAGMYVVVVLQETFPKHPRYSESSWQVLAWKSDGVCSGRLAP
jgi:hypothetical protein